MTKPIPVPDALSEPFWAGVRHGELRIQRCDSCRRYQFPAEPFCESCLSTELHHEPVSGRATVYSYTETRSGARHPAFVTATPYLVGLVELVEQAGLIMYSNFPGSALSDVKVGADAEFLTEEIAPGWFIPQFALTTRSASS